MLSDADYLAIALEQAQQGLGFCSPNPAVGAVLVLDGQVIGQGFHAKAGGDHAEIAALKSVPASTDLSQATLYVTLEPCAHIGRTPPCTQAIIEAGIQRVVFAHKDANPKVQGNGQAVLQAAGVNCEHQPLDSIAGLYQPFDFWLKTRKPWVRAKLAVTADAKVAGPQGKPIKITGPEADALTHQYRKQSAAILTTLNTLLADDPQLNARCDDGVYAKPLFILDAELALPAHLRCFKTAQPLICLHCEGVPQARIEHLNAKGVRCVAVELEQGKLSWSSVLEAVGQLGYYDLWVEAGPTCFLSLLTSRLLQEAWVYKSQQVLGEGVVVDLKHPTLALADQQTWHQMGDDISCHWTWFLGER